MEHGAEGKARRRIPGWAKVLAWVFGVFLGAALAFAIIQPIKVLPRIRVAPGYALTDAQGTSVTSETARGALTLYTWAPPEGCGAECDDIDATVREVRERVAAEVDLGDTEFRVITIALADDPSTAELAAAAERSGADGDTWRWVGGDWDRIRTVVGAGFRRYADRLADGTVDFDPGFVLVDGNGVIRMEYLYRTIASDADRIVRQVDTLGDELRYSHGAGALAYEAAHLFSCYG